ncbi:MAG: galactose mutarotase [Alphaproteobacteria bacterium MedPE-SWcel]|nr:MAG: galactose mutarotase [Alphaproteobacteria bacterium MedPE-SWcel]
MTAAQIIDHGIHNGHLLKEARLRSGGLSLSLLNVGAVTRDLRLHHNGADRPLVLGFDDPAEYLANPDYLGAIAGRVAGRIKDARFELDGRVWSLAENEGRNQLHGGPGALSHVLWEMELLSDGAVRLCYHSPDGDNGYPGAVDFTVVARLDDMALEYHMTATVTQPTPISLAQHNYYNLAGGVGPIWDHRLHVDATGYLMLDETAVPNGEIAPLDGMHFDMRRGKSLGDLDPDRLGSDINLVFDAARDQAVPVASLTAPDGVRMRVFTDQPGAQVYTASGLTPNPGGLPGQKIDADMGVCFEPQGFPNAVNQAHFPDVIATPDRPYRQNLRLEFDTI